MRPPFARTTVAAGIAEFTALLRRRAKARADRQRLDGLMGQVCQLRADRQCTEADLDKAAAKYAAAAINIARQGA